MPDLSFIKLGQQRLFDESIPMRYYQKDTLKYSLFEFLFNGDPDSEATARNKLLSVVFIFNNSDTRFAFIEYARLNWDSYKNDYWNSIPKMPTLYGTDLNSDIFEEEWKQTHVLKKLYSNFYLDF